MNLKKKEIRESQNVSIKKIALHEKEILNLNDKILSQERNLKELSVLLAGKDNEKIDKPYIKFQAKHNIDELNTTIEQLKKIISNLEEMLDEKNKIIENDKILNENKYNYMENQNDKLKEELNESKTNFIKTIEKLKEKLNNEKENLSRSSILEINLKHQTEMNNLKQTYEKVHKELIMTNKEFDRELKIINNYLINYDSIKIEIDSLKKEFRDILNENNRLNLEFEKMKKEGN